MWMLNTFMLLFFTVFPIALILLFVYLKDREKEPLVLLLTFFCLGILASFLVIQLSKVITPIIPFMSKKMLEMTFLEKIVYNFIIVAFIEEICKWIMVYCVGYHHKEFDEIYDIMIYAIFVSLGFALFENIVYVLLLSSSLQVAILRAISAIPGHACDAIFMGYYLSMAKMYYRKDKKEERKNIILSIVTPTLLHGIYDFCLILISTNLSGNQKTIISSICILMFSIFVSTLYMYSYRRIRDLSNSNYRIRNNHE